MRYRLPIFVLSLLACVAPACADDCEIKAAEIAEKIGLDAGERTQSGSIALSARDEGDDDYGAYLLCKGAQGTTLRFLSPPSPGQKWYQFVGRSGAILTGVKASSIALGAQNCVENARLRKTAFRSPGSAFQMQCTVSRNDDRAELSLAGR
jgi:hypothetical protein